MRALFGTIFFLLTAACATEPVQNSTLAEPMPDNSVQVMVVGSYHMAGSNRNVIDIEVESVLTPHKQSELAAVANALAVFEPNVIATEREAEPPEYTDPGYLEFTPETLKTNPNERVQVAYRLANLVNTNRVYAIDEQSSEGEPDYFPFRMLMGHIEKTGQTETFEALFAKGRHIADEFAASQSEKNNGRTSLRSEYWPDVLR